MRCDYRTKLNSVRLQLTSKFIDTLLSLSRLVFSRLVVSASRLIEPLPTVQPADNRHQARLLASILLSILLTTGLLFVVRLPLAGLSLTAENGARLIIALLMGPLILLSRRGQVWLTSLVAVTTGSLILFALALTTEASRPSTALNYLVVVLLFGSLFLPAWLNGLLFIAQLTGILVVGYAVPLTVYRDVLTGPFSLHLTVGVVVILIAGYRNALERHRLEQLAHSERRLNDVILNNVDGMLVLDQTGQVCFLNPAAVSLLRQPPTEILGAPFGLPLGTGQPIELDIPGHGAPCIVELQTTAISWDGAPAQLISLRDITARKQAEDAVRTSEAKIRHFVEQSMEGITLLDEAGRICEWNPAQEVISGLTRSEALGQPAWVVQMRLTPPEFATPARAAAVQAALQTALRTGQAPFLSQVIEAPFLRADGTLRVIQQLAFPIRTERGFRLGMTSWDITDRKAAEDRLRLLSRAVEQSPTSIVMTDPTGAIIYVNPQFEAVTGYSAAEVVGRNPRLLKSGHTPAAHYADLWQAITHGQTWTGEFVNQKKSGDLYWESASISPITDARGHVTHYVAVKEDITERKRMEVAEREQRALAEALHDTATALNSTLHLAELFERILSNLGRVVEHDTASIMLIDSTGEAAYVARAREYITTDHAPVTPLRRLMIKQFSTLQHMIETGRPVIVPDTALDQTWVLSAEADWQRSYVGAPIIIQGQVVGFLNVNRARPGFYHPDHADRLQAFADQAAVALNNAQLYDQVQRNAAELEQRVAQRTRELTDANARLTELDRLKDDFVSRISHELRTPLTSIRIYLELLDHGKVEKQAKYKDVLNRESARLQTLIEDLLTIQRIGADDYVGRLQALNVNQLVLDLMAEYSATARARQLILSHDLATCLPSAVSDPTLARQAVSNILKNALDYTPPGGQILLTSQERRLADQRWATLTVADTGPGISDEDRPHIFERFYRGTAARDYTVPGTGLGLAISQDILHKLGGRVTLDSEPELGAVFTVWLPVSTAETADG